VKHYPPQSRPWAVSQGIVQGEEIVMPYIKLAFATLILVGASLLAPAPGKAATTYCPEGCFPCHPNTQQCCTYVGGRFLKCAP
jgi:hypothetical protein